MPYKNIFLNLLLLPIAALAIWTSLLIYQGQPRAPHLSKTQPDAFMVDVSALILNKLGKPNMRISSPVLIHYPKDDTSKFTKPYLTLYRESPQPWYIRSKLAIATAGIENVNFEEDVLIQHAADENHPATLIKTAHLLVHPNKKTAETTDLITMSQPNLIVHAVGMIADMNTGDIKLLSQARGEYEPGL